MSVDELMGRFTEDPIPEHMLHADELSALQTVRRFLRTWHEPFDIRFEAHAHGVLLGAKPEVWVRIDAHYSHRGRPWHSHQWLMPKMLGLVALGAERLVRDVEEALARKIIRTMTAESRPIEEP